jgi:hypothetical protein
MSNSLNSSAMIFGINWIFMNFSSEKRAANLDGIKSHEEGVV